MVELGSRAYLTQRLALSYFAIFFFVGIALPYWPVWLAAEGFDHARIALLLGLAPWARAVANPTAGWLADSRVRGVILLRILSGATTLGYLAFALTQGFAAVFVASLFVGFVHAPIIPIVDGVTLRSPADYGRVRLWGSVGFIVASILGGWLLESRPEAVILWAMIACSAVVWMTAFLVPAGLAPKRSAQALAGGVGQPRASQVKGTLRAVMAGRGFVAFLVSCGFLHASHAVLYVFGTLHWREAGLNDRTIGLLWGEGVVAEILLFMVAARLHRILRPNHWLLLAAVGGIVRWPILASTSAIIPLVGAQALHALTFAAMQVGAMAFIRGQIPDRSVAAATTLYAGLSAGLAYGIAIPVVGLVYAEVGAQAYWLMGLLSLLSSLATWILGRRMATQDKEEEEAAAEHDGPV